MISAIISIGTGGASLIATQGISVSARILTTASMISSLDDIAGLSNKDGKTPIQKIVGEKAGTTSKIIVGFIGSKSALLDAVGNLNDTQKATTSVFSFVNDQGNTMYGLFQFGTQDDTQKE